MTYRPSIGGNSPSSEQDSGASPVGTYADLDILLRDIQTLLGWIEDTEETLEDELLEYALHLDVDDRRLVESQQAEWPDFLSEPRDQVSYRQYRALKFRSTTTASYIRKRYEESARDVTGTSALDILTLLGIIRDEVFLIKDFLTQYIGNVDDTSEYRVLEQFQDWVVGALDSVRELRSLYESPQKFLPREEVENITPTEAMQAQAVFKTKLNSNNEDIKKDIESLKENFSEFAPTFYSRLLGPALKYRLDVGRRILPTGSGVTKEVERSSKVLESHLRQALADQMRRRTLFKENMTHLVHDMEERDKYRSYINQLATKARPIPTTGPRVMTITEESPEEVQYWEGIIQDPAEDFEPSHAVLTHLEEDTHPQYLHKGGGLLTGDMELEEEVRLDGMRPSTHRHTGNDGTRQILGTDIIDLREEIVDVDDDPPIPYDLGVISFKEAIHPPGYVVMDTAIKFKGHARYRYEIQITPLEDIDRRQKLVLGVDHLATGVHAPPGGRGEFMHTAKGDE